MKNYYAILEVPAGAGLEEIRQAYHRLTQEHLDDDKAFADLKEAFEVLTTSAQRETYDRTLNSTVIGGAVRPGSKTRQCPLHAGAQCPVLNAQVTAADTFCPECGYLLSALSGSTDFGEVGGSDPSALARLEGTDGSVSLLQVGVNVVGRESADVLLVDKTVSRHHARLELAADGSVTLEDLGSTNGTQVNDVPLVPPVQRRLADGDRLRFGSVATVLRLPVSEAAAPERTLTAMAEIPLTESPLTEMPMSEKLTENVSEKLTENVPEAPPAQLTDIREGAGQVYPLLPNVTTFGRRPDNTVVLTGDPYVSGSHAKIAFQNGQYLVTDIGSTNGTLLNGDRLSINVPAELSHGDVILIGAAALRFEVIGMPLDEEREDVDEEELEDAALNVEE